jgi:hypothetical protein
MSIVRQFPHMSVSRANEFLERRPRFYAHYLLGRKFPDSPEMHRGTAVEIGIRVACYDGLPIGLAIDSALEHFDGAVPESEESAEVRRDIQRLVECGVSEMAALIESHGPVVGYQRRLEAYLPDGLIQWIGFTDFTLLDGTIVDTKIRGKTATLLPASYARQGAFYRHASGNGCRVKFLILSPLQKDVKASVLELEDHTPFIHQLRMTELAIDSLLQLGMVEDLAGAFMPDPDDWSFRHPEAKAIASEIWGL